MKILRQIRFVPTYACNLRCKYCYLKDSLEKGSQDNFSNVIPAAKLLAQKVVESDYRVKEVIFHGGEPTTLPPEMLGEAGNAFLPAFGNERAISIQSNGVALTPEYVSVLHDNLDPKIHTRFSVSLDGPKSITDKNRGRGTYDKAMGNILALKERGYTIHVLGVITKETMSILDELEVWVRQLSERDIYCQYQFASEPDNLTDEEQVGFAHWMFSRGWHFAPRETDLRACASKGNNCFMYLFNADGAIPACNRSGEYQRFRWTDIPFEEAIQARKGWFANKPVDPKCEYCPIKNACNSGCPAFRRNGRANSCYYLQTIYQLEAQRLGVSAHEAVYRLRRF